MWISCKSGARATVVVGALTRVGAGVAVLVGGEGAVREVECAGCPQLGRSTRQTRRTE